jgi:RNA methyltransferase, TrmH family
VVSEPVFTERTPRVVAARKLHRRAGRTATGRFLVEGAQAVREATGHGAQILEVFATSAAAGRHPDLLAAAGDRGARVSPISDRAAAALSETITPQGIFAVCATVAVPLAAALAGTPRLVAALVDVADPGNAGTVIRVADAAGADAVVLAGDSVDPHNGKCVRASAGSLFHLPIAVERDPMAALDALRAAGLRLLAAHARADADLETLAGLGGATAWLFGSEAHGLPPRVLAAADEVVAVPIYGRAESLNLATAAAVCLYRSAAAHRVAP